MPVIARARHRVISTRAILARPYWLLALPLLLWCGAGCSAPAPAAAFVEQAQRLHQEALAATIDPDPDLREYFDEMGRRIIDAARAAAPAKARGAAFGQVRFHLVDVPTVNTFSTGGTHVYIYNGLFQQCDSEEELATAMAHAFAHVLNLDVEKSGIEPEPRRPLPLTAYQFVINRFTPQQERQADELAFMLYSRGGWEPARYEYLFRRLGDRFGGPSDPDRLPLDGRADAARLQFAGISRSWRRLPVADRRTFLALRAQARPRMAGAAQPGQRFLRAFPNCVIGADQPDQRRAQAELRPPPPAAVRLEPN